jgi:hypothetical protein
VAALDQEDPKPVDGGGFTDPRRTRDADTHGVAGVGQQPLHQIARRRLMIAAPAFDQRDGPRQRRAASGAKILGQGADVDGGVIGQGHAFVYSDGAGEARGFELGDLHLVQQNSDRN